MRGHTRLRTAMCGLQGAEGEGGALKAEGGLIQMS